MLAVVVAAVVALARDGIGLLRPALVVLAPSSRSWPGSAWASSSARVSDRPYATRQTHLVTAAGVPRVRAARAGRGRARAHARRAPARALDARRLARGARRGRPRAVRGDLATSRQASASAVLDRLPRLRRSRRDDARDRARRDRGRRSLAGRTAARGRVRDGRARARPLRLGRRSPRARCGVRRSSSGSPRSIRSLTARRLAAVSAITLATVVGVVALRGGDLAQFGRFVGLLEAQETTSADVADLLAPDAARLLRPPGLRRPPADGRRLAGDPGVRRRSSRISPTRTAASRTSRRRRSRRPPSRTGSRTPTCRRSRISASIGLVLLLAALAIPIVVGARVALRRRGDAGTALAGAAVGCSPAPARGRRKVSSPASRSTRSRGSASGSWPSRSLGAVTDG